MSSRTSLAGGHRIQIANNNPEEHSAYKDQKKKIGGQRGSKQRQTSIHQYNKSNQPISITGLTSKPSQDIIANLLTTKTLDTSMAKNQRYPTMKKLSISISHNQKTLLGDTSLPCNPHLNALRKVMHIKHKSQATVAANLRSTTQITKPLGGIEDMKCGSLKTSDLMQKQILNLREQLPQTIIEERPQSQMLIQDASMEPINFYKASATKASQDYNTCDALVQNMKSIKAPINKLVLDGSSIMETQIDLSQAENQVLHKMPLSASNKALKQQMMPTTSQYSLLNHYFSKSKKSNGFHTSSFSQLKKGVLGKGHTKLQGMKEEQFTHRIPDDGVNGGGSQSHREYGIASGKDTGYKQPLVGNFDFSTAQ